MYTTKKKHDNLPEEKINLTPGIGRSKQCVFHFLSLFPLLSRYGNVRATRIPSFFLLFKIFSAAIIQ